PSRPLLLGPYLRLDQPPTVALGALERLPQRALPGGIQLFAPRAQLLLDPIHLLLQLAGLGHLDPAPAIEVRPESSSHRRRRTARRARPRFPNRATRGRECDRRPPESRPRLSSRPDPRPGKRSDPRSPPAAPGVRPECSSPIPGEPPPSRSPAWRRGP